MILLGPNAYGQHDYETKQYEQLFHQGNELKILHQYVPDGNDVAQRTGEHEEMEYGVHVAALVERIEDGAGNVTYAFGHNPNEGGCGYGVDEGFEGHEDAQSHADETKGLDVGMLLEADEADDGTDDGTRPHEDEKSPAPIALRTQGYQRQWRVGAGNVPIDGSVVPMAQAFLPFRTSEQGVVGGRGDIAGQHAKEVETDAQTRPGILPSECHPQEYCSESSSHDDASSVAPRIPKLFLMGIFNGHRVDFLSFSVQRYNFFS